MAHRKEKYLPTQSTVLLLEYLVRVTEIISAVWDYPQKLASFIQLFCYNRDECEFFCLQLAGRDSRKIFSCCWTKEYHLSLSTVQLPCIITNSLFLSIHCPFDLGKVVRVWLFLHHCLKGDCKVSLGLRLLTILPEESYLGRVPVDIEMVLSKGWNM